MYKFFLCMRYLRKRRIAFFAVAAVALCVGLLIVVTSLFNGFIDSYMLHLERLLGQIVLAPTSPIAEYRELAEHLEKLETVALAKPVVQTGALLYLGRGDVRGVEVWGIDLARQAKEESFRGGLLLLGENDEAPGFKLAGQPKQAARAWLEQRLGREIPDEDLPVGAIAGIGVLGRPDELTDEYDRASIKGEILARREGMQITTGRLTESQSDQVELPAERRRGACWLMDAVETGLHDADTQFVYLPVEYVRDLIGVKGSDGKFRCQGSVQITAVKGADEQLVIEQARQSWQDFAAAYTTTSNPYSRHANVSVSRESPRVRQYTQAIRKQLVVMQLILGLICLVAALLMFVILLMIVMQKKKEIGIIRSLGSSRLGVAAIYLGFGGGVGVVGSVLGVVLGWGATRNIGAIEGVLTKLLGFKIWRSGVYLFSEIPHEVAWDAVGWIMAAGAASAVLGAVLPAWRAARLQPVEALRYE